MNLLVPGSRCNEMTSLGVYKSISGTLLNISSSSSLSRTSSYNMLSFALIPLFVASAFAGFAVPLPTYTHEQNTATGEYAYNYAGDNNAKTEIRHADGTTTGAYSYVDAYGISRSVQYIADENGFRTNTVPLDTPAVAAAKADHLIAHGQATLAALSHQRKKRGIAFAAPIPIAYHASYLPTAVSHQSRVDIHHSAPTLYSTTYHATPLLFRKKRGIAAGAYAAALPVTYTHSLALPYATSSQSRYQVHNDAKIVETYAAPVAAPLAPIAAPVAVAAAPVATYSSLPLSTSSQSRFQIHNGAKIISQTHTPVFAAAAPIFSAPTHGYFPAESVISEEGIAVESA